MSGTVTDGYQSFISQRRQLMEATDDPALKKHYQAEIAVVRPRISATSIIREAQAAARRP